MSGDLPKRPNHRQEFKIAIICALTLEADMVEMILDKDWADEGVKFGKAPGDFNTYTTGVIADQNVVLAYCSTIGGNNAAQVATGLRSSFTGIRLAFVVGVCGAFPLSTDGEEILLGDCMISTAVVQFDLGRFGPKGFAMKDGLQGLGRVGLEIGTLLAKLKGRRSRLRLKNHLASYLQALQNEDPELAQCPGRKEDRLFISSYKHDHGEDVEFCKDCDATTGICGKTCVELHCESKNLVLRNRPESDVTPNIYFGHFASSNSVIKDADKRDAVAKANKVIAFEMEGSGVWDIYPTIVIKAACDYADSHKNKEWQPYAAAVAAAGLKAFLQELDFPDEETLSKDNITKSLDMRPSGNVNDFGSSTIHGTVANNVYGGIHYHQGQILPSTATPQQNEIDVVARADAAICSYYTSGDRLEITRLSGEILPLDKCYINLALTDQTDEKHEKVENLPFSLETRIEQSDNIKKQIALGELFMPRQLSGNVTSKSRRIFIQGRAGVGKTTLCKKIVDEFLHHRLGDKLFDRLLWIPLRRLKNKPGRYGLQDLIKDTFSPQVDDWDELAAVISKKLLNRDFLGRTLFLFDGLDEISYQWKRDDSMYEFIADMICDAPNAIVTSRPQANSFNIGSFDLKLETIGFTSDQINTYIENCVENEELAIRMKEMIRYKPLLQGLLRIPIQLDAFCYTWPRRSFSNKSHESVREQHMQPDISSQDDLSTMTTLYQAITDELCIKDTDRLEKAAQPRRLHATKIRTLLQEELDFLGELAFQGLVNGIATFSPDQQDRIESHMFHENKSMAQDSFVLERLSFLRTSDIDQDPSKRNYHFLHLTFQEFFAAKHFVRHWRAEADLTRLDLVSRNNTVKGRVLPLEFLQTEKYNPQLNVFWRFVTGLTQVRSYEQTDAKEIHDTSQRSESGEVVEFFAELYNKPLDLLGGAHCYLLMYCLSEVVVDQREEIQAFYQRQQMLLRDGVLAQFKMTDEIDIISESEFPENLLREYLQNEGDIPRKLVLQCLHGHQFLTTVTLDIAANLLDSESPSELRLEAIELICRKLEMASQDTLTRTTRVVQVLLEDKDSDVCCSTLEKLIYSSALPKQIVNIMIALLKYGQEKVLKPTARVLLNQEPISKEITDALLTILRGEVNHSLKAVLEVLDTKWHLPEVVITTLISLLKQDDEYMSERLLDIIRRQESLSTEHMALFIAMLTDEDTRGQIPVLRVLKTQSYLPKEVIIVLMALMKNGRLEARGSAALALGAQSSLAIEDVTSLVAMLKDEEVDVQILAAEALRGQLALPKEVITLLLMAMKSENESLRVAAAETLSVQSSLPEEVIISLIPFLEDDRFNVRWSIIQILGRSSLLTEQVLAPLIAILREGDIYDRKTVVEAFITQPSLPSGAVTELLTVIQDGDLEEDSIWEYAVEALSRQLSLSLKASTILIAYLNKIPIWKEYHPEVNRHILANINNLDDRALRRVWSYWLNTVIWDDDIICYEYKGCLYIWLEGKRHKITDRPSRTQRLLRLLREARGKQSLAEILEESNEIVELAGTSSAKAEIVPTIKSIWNSMVTMANENRIFSILHRQ